MLIGCVIDDELGDHANPSFVSFSQEFFKIAKGSIIGVDVEIVRDVISVVSQGGRIEGQKPDGRDTQILKIIELLRHPTEVADTVSVVILEGLHVEFIDDGILVPEGIVRKHHR
jgi:hypothetical protein